MTKTTKTETRARHYITQLAARLKHGESATFAIEWQKSRTWGSNPQVYDSSTERCLNVSGCGYDKMSTALALMLCHLPGLTETESRDVAALAGSGESEVQRRCAALGWHVAVRSVGRMTDVVTFRKATDAEKAAALAEIAEREASERRRMEWSNSRAAERAETAETAKPDPYVIHRETVPAMGDQPAFTIHFCL